ncbi:MAG: hypothetical protein D6722_28830 [Bacteroidetes bacterium]|nr:MAG: hypothetical protein D6722_28830 [Bacteroidota bacterium]
MNRRNFVQKAALGSAALLAPNPFRALARRGDGIPLDQLFVGTMIIPSALYAKGVAATLDEMQALAGINTVMPFTHTHVGRQYRADYRPFEDADGHPLTDIYVRTHEAYYPDPRWADRGPATRYADRDVIDELVEAGASRGIQVYGRILEPYVITGVIPGFEVFAEEDALGAPGDHVCFNHPGYIAYWEAVIEDLVRSHPQMAGFKFGQERGGPLQNALEGKVVTCFCPHCLRKARQQGLDAEEARQGFLALKQFSDQVRAGEAPPNGRFMTFFRTLSDYPELLAWERFWMQNREDQRRRMYAQIKRIRPSVQVGWHIDHSMGWALGMQAFWPYEQMGPYSDWLSIALYFDSFGRRSKGHYDRLYKDLLFGDADPALSYPMYLSILGLDPAQEPAYVAHAAEDTEFSDEYVYREVRRAVTTVAGKAKVYGRLGFDMPKYDCDIQPEQVYQATTRMFEARVDGVFCGREWDELQPKNAEAFGKAVRDYLKRR